MTLGERIRYIREQLGKTQKEFADMLGIDVQTISCYERGKLIPRPKKLNLIATKCKVNTSWLLSGLGAITISDDTTQEELQEVLNYLTEHPAERKAILTLVRGAKANTAAIENIRSRRKLKPGTA